MERGNELTFTQESNTTLAAVRPHAGHGVELAGENFLLPTDIAKLGPSQQRRLRQESITTEMLDVVSGFEAVMAHQGAW